MTSSERSSSSDYKATDHFKNMLSIQESSRQGDLGVNFRDSAEQGENPSDSQDKQYGMAKEDVVPGKRKFVETEEIPSEQTLEQIMYPHVSKKRRLGDSGGATNISESMQNTGNIDGDSEPPPEAVGKDLEHMTRVKQLADQSGDPHTKIGAVLVDTNGDVIGEGYNHLPRDDLSWEGEADDIEDTKHPYVVYAADTAIRNAYKKKKDPKGATLYTNFYPGSREGVAILEAEIEEVVYLEEKPEWRKRYGTGATKKLFDGLISTRQVSMPQ